LDLAAGPRDAPLPPQIGTINDLLMKHAGCHRGVAQRHGAVLNAPAAEVLPVITSSITQEAQPTGRRTTIPVAAAAAAAAAEASS